MTGGQGRGGGGGVGWRGGGGGMGVEGGRYLSAALRKSLSPSRSPQGSCLADGSLRHL